MQDEGGLKDLRAELETAVLLLRDERFTLEYEKYVATKQRGQDFTVTFKTHTPFNVEVRRPGLWLFWQKRMIFVRFKVPN